MTSFLLKTSSNQTSNMGLNVLNDNWKRISIDKLILFWGWALFLNCLRFFMVRMVPLNYLTCKILEYLTNGFVLFVLVWTFFALIENKNTWNKRVLRQLLSIWLGCVLLQAGVYVVQIQVFHHVIFEFQHTLFMLFGSVAVFLSGVTLKNKWMLIGGVLFVLLTFISAFFSLKYQMGLEALGWFVSMVIPGYHALCIARKPQK